MSETNEFLGGTTIPYDTGLAMECHAITSTEDPRPLNLLDYYEYRTAHEVALEASRMATRQIRTRRDERHSDLEALQLPQAPRVYSYVCADLGMEPVGKLVYVSDKEDATTSGITYGERVSLVFRDRILQDFSDSPLLVEMAEGLNNVRVGGVAAHELVHLAGMQDKLFFTIDPWTQEVTAVKSPGTTLNDWPNFNKGQYFEEGLGVLVHSMYAWRLAPRSAQLATPKVFQSPSGTRLDIPQRLHLMGSLEDGYTQCGYGIERLVALAPQSWDIFMKSRKYNTPWMAARTALRGYLEMVKTGLFDTIDITDLDDLEQIMETTEKIDFAARAYGV